MARKLLRSGIEKLKPYEPGRPIEEVQREFGLDDVIKLASNESPYPPFAKAVKAMQERWQGLIAIPTITRPI